MEKYNKLFETIMEKTEKTFKVKLSDLYSPVGKIEKTIGQLNKKEYARDRGKPIRVSKMGKGKYFVIDGNHRVMEDMQNGKTEITAVLDRYVPDVSKGGYEDKIGDADQMSKYLGEMEVEIDESRIPKEIPRYLYHATYKQMLPTLKKTGLKPGSFLAKTYKEALSNAEMLENIDDDWRNNIVVFKINTGKLNKGKISVDQQDEPSEYGYNESIPYEILVRNS